MFAYIFIACIFFVQNICAMLAQPAQPVHVDTKKETKVALQEIHGDAQLQDEKQDIQEGGDLPRYAYPVMIGALKDFGLPICEIRPLESCRILTHCAEFQDDDNASRMVIYLNNKLDQLTQAYVRWLCYEQAAYLTLLKPDVEPLYKDTCALTCDFLLPKNMIQEIITALAYGLIDLHEKSQEEMIAALLATLDTKGYWVTIDYTIVSTGLKLSLALFNKNNKTKSIYSAGYILDRLKPEDYKLYLEFVAHIAREKNFSATLSIISMTGV